MKASPAFGVPIESGSRVITIEFERRPLEEDVSRKRKFPSAVLFEAGGHRIDLMPHLGGSIHAVSEIIDRFSHLFPAPAVQPDLSRVQPVEVLL
jgi:hypothetical protein